MGKFVAFEAVVSALEKRVGKGSVLVIVRVSWGPAYPCSGNLYIYIGVLGGQPAFPSCVFRHFSFLASSTPTAAHMKRNSDTEGSATKRPRLESGEDNLNLFDETRRKNATDLLDPATDDTGNIEANIFMVFPRGGRTRQLNLEMRENDNIYRFLVVLAPKVVEKLDPFPFRPGLTICLSLKGAQITRRAPSSAPHYLPVALTFEDGLAAMFTSGPDAGNVFNTWEGLSVTEFFIDSTFLPITSSRLV